MFDFLQYLVGDIHSTESVDFRNDGGGIEKDGEVCRKEEEGHAGRYANALMVYALTPIVC